jgi:hypothetical protein
MTQTPTKPQRSGYDPLAEMDEEESRAQRSKFSSFFLTLKAGEKTWIRPLLNLDACIVLNMHDKFDETLNKSTVSAVCAQEIDLDCQHCADAAQDKKLHPRKHFFLPVYVHGVWKQNDKKEWVAVYTKNESGEQVSYRGVRLLELKGDIKHQLRSNYQESDERTITNMDFVIERKGSGRADTHYTVTPKLKAGGIPPDVPVQNRETVRESIIRMREPKAVDSTSQPYRDEPPPFDDTDEFP